MRVRMVKSRADNLGLLAAGQRWRKTISYKCTHSKFLSRHAGILIGSCTVAIGRKERLRDATSQVGQHFQDAGTFALDKSSELEELMELQLQERPILTGSLIHNRWRLVAMVEYCAHNLGLLAVGELWRKHFPTSVRIPNCRSDTQASQLDGPQSD